MRLEWVAAFVGIRTMTQDKPKTTPAEQRIRRDERTAAIRLRFTIRRSLDERGITTPAGIGEALRMSADEATKLLTRHQWREGDVALLEAGSGTAGAVGLMALATAFAHCRCCSSICGVMRKAEAQSGGWLSVLDWTCECGAPPTDLVPASEDQIQRVIAGTIVPLLVVVPDSWPGE